MKRIVKLIGFAFTGMLMFVSYQVVNAKEVVLKPLVKVQQRLSSTKVVYELAKGYFVKNTVKSPLIDPKLGTKKAFDQVFGAATTMGAKGKPTSIDFNKKFVIAIVGEETDKNTRLEPISLEKDTKGNIVFSYRKVEGAKQTFTIVPNLIVVVDKSNNGMVLVKEVK